MLLFNFNKKPNVQKAKMPNLDLWFFGFWIFLSFLLIVLL